MAAAGAFSRSARAWRALLSAVAVVVAGCALPPTGPADPRDASPVRLHTETAGFTLSFAPRDAEMASQDSERFDAFLQDYLRRGRSPLRVVMRPVEDVLIERARQEMVTTLLVREGIAMDRVIIDRAAPKGLGINDFHFSFRRYAVTVGECGDWSGQAGFNPTGLPHTNFGCAYQRDIGLMLADPGDLARPRETGPIDAHRTDRVIDSYRVGRAAGSTKPRNEATEFGEIK